MSRSSVLALSLLAFLAGPAAAGPPPDVAVTTCGQIVPKKALGYLTGDLDCTGFTGQAPNTYGNAYGAAVLLNKKSRLDLRGFTLTAGFVGVYCDGFVCGDVGQPCSKGPCEVFNGTIVSASSDVGVGGVQPVVHDVTISGFNIGIIGFKNMTVRNVTVTGNHENGLQGSGGYSTAFHRMRIFDSTITGNGRLGASSGGALSMKSSTVTGNATAAFCAQSNICGDIQSGFRPHVVASTCDTSLGPKGPWGVCSLD